MFSNEVVAQCNSVSFTDQADKFLAKHVSNGLISYQSIHSNPEDLNDLVEMIQTKDLTTWSQKEKLAFYINAYNILVIKNVIDHYPVSSPLKVKGFFKSTKFSVAGEQLTLDELENKKVRPLSDARFHFALVCAAKGCPPIIPNAYRADNLDAQLDRQTTRAVNDPEFTKIGSNGSVQLSQIFNWYKADFIQNDNSLIDYLNLYRNDPLDTSSKVSFYEYDWRLNGK